MSEVTYGKEVQDYACWTGGGDVRHIKATSAKEAATLYGVLEFQGAGIRSVVIFAVLADHVHTESFAQPKAGSSNGISE